MKIKFFKSYFITAFAMMALMMSCVGDLDVKPIDPFVITADKVYTR